MPRTILFTNIMLTGRSGTEVVTEQLAEGLRRRGHRPVLYTPHPGALAEHLRWRGHLVISDPAALPKPPDLIHAHHTGPAMAALAAHPGVPALFVCHDATAPFDAAPPHPRLRRLFAVDERCRARLVAEGAAPASIGLLPNAVELARIPPRPAPLPDRPRRALAMTKHAAHLPALRAACAAAGISLEEAGSGPGRMTDTPEAGFAEADLVFATARTALEAAAAGAGVIVCDARGCAGFLTRARAEAWLPWNLGAGVLKDPSEVAVLAAAIAEYSAGEAEAAAALVRAESGIETMLDRLEAIYDEMLATPVPVDPAAEAAALGRFLSGWVPSFNPALPWYPLVEAVAPRAPAPPPRIEALVEALAGDLGGAIAGLTRAQAGLPPEVAALRQDLARLGTEEAAARARDQEALGAALARIGDRLEALARRPGEDPPSWPALRAEVADLRWRLDGLAARGAEDPPSWPALQAEVARIDTRLAALAARRGPGGWIGDGLRGLWRRLVPHRIRAALHRRRAG
ncbi:glycosyl transferase family 4 [Humitalea rosea]|uniref:Glycosyl transferase family 4 n=1 Tax=Humitalea rosea TaxID=990373 RepID=A0A2W7IU46_9PROT|nr:glycosyltransferase family 4 protein [Humitalea rosea]PZW50979.1 glycosyl transferase family 4 [Humitalea rosea]